MEIVRFHGRGGTNIRKTKKTRKPSKRGGYR
jgi:hypothetical protein